MIGTFSLLARLSISSKKASHLASVIGRENTLLDPTKKVHKDEYVTPKSNIS